MLYKQEGGKRVEMTADEEAGTRDAWAAAAVAPVSAEDIQSEANALMAETDWVHLPDANVTTPEKNAILAFRTAVQAISHSPRPRDLGFPALEAAFKRNGR